MDHFNVIPMTLAMPALYVLVTQLHSVFDGRYRLTTLMIVTVLECTLTTLMLWTNMGKTSGWTLLLAFAVINFMRVFAVIAFWQKLYLETFPKFLGKGDWEGAYMVAVIILGWIIVAVEMAS